MTVTRGCDINEILQMFHRCNVSCCVFTVGLARKSLSGGQGLNVSKAVLERCAMLKADTVAAGVSEHMRQGRGQLTQQSQSQSKFALSSERKL